MGEGRWTQIQVEVAPFGEEELRKRGLQNELLNFADLKFRSKPQRPETAIFSLLFLGTDLSTTKENVDPDRQNRAEPPALLLVPMTHHEHSSR